jgi:hypothetical protein
VSRSTGSSFGLERWAVFGTKTGWTDHLVGDYDGDGNDDVVSRHGGGRWWLQRSTTTQFDVQPG